ncbi:hypothetical protein OFN97_04525 [Campylobacter sp. VBCF_05 NA6]|uniref:hypothetical protein n=1 Tax=unclassified Campylobacter TaxID=2593542 RepID=UPI0022E9E100|nr:MULTISPECIES: hypothetical protein [unclassified Campylobacter]MDA3057948.1 hypothetical protein [Campylobacter sp. VBCF_04 NA7]MDA3059275.1 hypothetical protein [Campylobacter sp. VBCF_05 NA6]
MKIYIGKGWENHYLKGTLSVGFDIDGYLSRLCYEMALYVKFESIREILGDIEYLDMQDFKRIIDDGAIVIKYPNPQIPNLITGYLKGSHYDRKITPFLIYAIFMSAKYNLGCIEKNTTTREKEIDFVRDMIRIFSVANSESFMFKAFVGASGVVPRVAQSNLEESNILNQNASLASALIMELIGEEKIACRAPIVLFVVANFIHKHQIGNYQNFADHKMFRDYGNFHDEEFAQTIEFAPEFSKDKKAKELILKMLDEVETLNLSQTQISNLAIDIFARTAPNQFQGRPDEVVKHFRENFHTLLDYNCENSDISVADKILKYAEKIYEIYYGKIDNEAREILSMFFYGDRRANQFFIQQIYEEIKPTLFGVNQLMTLIAYKFITLKNLNNNIAENLIKNFCNAFLTDLKTYYQWN